MPILNSAVRAALLWAAITCCAAPFAAAQPVRANLAQGIVEGVREDAVDRFLGVPYAAAPVGDLRWRPPQPGRRWRGVRPALEYSAGCAQTPRGPFGPFTHEYVDQAKAPNEDCLYLNVWTPSRREAAGLPILLWIHGGAFIGGAASVPIYNGVGLAREGVVVVSLNYRLGAFGYFAAADTGAANFGVLDVIAALHWLHENARAFGADPNRITIAGQSAGAAMVNILLMSPQARDLFSGAISQSMPLGGARMRTRTEAAAMRAMLLQAFSAADVDALRAVSAEEILDATEIIAPGPMAPVLDGATLFGDPLELAKQGRRQAAPLMAGVTAQENAFLGGRLAFRTTFASRYGDAAGRFLDLYPAASDAEAREAANASNRDRLVLGLGQWLDGASPASAVYLYMFNHAEPGAHAATVGAFHSSEIPYVFGTLSAAPERGFAVEDEALSARLMQYWANFVRSGDPNGPNLPRWAPATADARLVMDLGGAWAPVLGPSAVRRAFFDDYFAAGGRAALF